MPRRRQPKPDTKPIYAAVVFAGERLVGQALAAALVDAGTAESATLADGPDDATALCLRLRPALVILSLDGARPAATVDLVRRIRTALPSTAIVLATRETRPSTLRDAYDAGATFALPLDAGAPELRRWSRRAMVSPTQVPWDQWLVARAPHEGEKRMPASPTAQALSPRQQQILLHLCRGMSNASIARALGISEKTVRNHLTAMYTALGTRRRTKAVLVALAMGLVDSGPHVLDSRSRATTAGQREARDDHMPADARLEIGLGVSMIPTTFHRQAGDASSDALEIHEPARRQTT